MRILLLAFITLLFGCSTATKAKATLTKDEEARQALDNLDYDTAIDLYKELIEEDPEDYENYRFLGAAYAASAGFDIIAVAKGGGDGGGSGSILDSMGSFLPSDPSADQLDRMGLAKDILLAIPADLRSKTNTDVAYSSGAAQQLEIYQSAYSVMYLNRFAQVTPTGALDVEKLETMTDTDVENILNNFSQVAATGGEGVPEAAQKVLTDIDAQEGETQKDKLVNFIKAKKGTGT